MRTNALRKPMLGKKLPGETVPRPELGFAARPETRLHRGTNGNRHVLRMYTEEEVSQMLQVSLSQLRKWRMKENRGSEQGPPFKKIGRLVRYPEQALFDYVNAL